MTTATLRDTRRITEHDADFRRLHQATAKRLRASVRRYVQELRWWLTADAQRAFIQRHTDILHQAYQDAHEAGAEDFVDHHHSHIDTQAVLPRTARLARVIGFYLPSVAKMAREGADLHHQELRQRQMLAERKIARRPPPSPYDDDEYDYETYPYQQTDDTPMEGSFLDQWAQGDAMGARVLLQANIVWPGLQDGYVDAGTVDGRYTQIVWDLEPSVKEHCFDCLDMAAYNPYDAPGSGGNELWNTPGDGNTSCGAACRCSLRYVPSATTLADLPDHYQVVRLAGHEESRVFFNPAHEPAGAPNGGQFAPKGAGEAGGGGIRHLPAHQIHVGLNPREQAHTWRFYNPAHEPAGQPNGGQFAPKGGGGGGDGAAPRSYTRAPRPLSEMHGTAHEMEAWLNEHRSEQTWHVADVHPDILHEMAGVLDRMKAAYPEAHARLTTITTDGDWQQHQHAYAYVGNNGRELHLNPAWLGDKAAFEAQFNQERANGWQANGAGMTASEQLATHEFGHVVDAELSATHDAFEPVISRSGIGKVDATFRMMQSAMIGRLTGQVSRYAQHDHWEMFAEAFVMIHSSQRLPGQPGRMIERLRNFLGHAYKQRYPRGSYTDLDGISADERLDAAQRLRAVAQDLDVHYS